MSLFDDVDAAWLGGFLDGEGCFQIVKHERRPGALSYQPSIMAANADLGLLERCRDLGEGTVCRVRPASSAWKATYRWNVRGVMAGRVAKAVLPYLHGKHEQALILLELRESIEEPASRGINYRTQRVSADATAWRETLKLAINALNRRGSTAPPTEQLLALEAVRSVLPEIALTHLRGTA